MKQWKQLLMRLVYPGIVLTVLIPLVGFGLLAAVAVLGITDSPLTYVSYVLAFYALVVLVMACIPLGKRGVQAYRNRQVDPEVQMRKALSRSLMINVGYAGFNLLSGALYRSIWLMSNGLYYLILSAIRLALVRYERKRDLADDPAQKHQLGWSGFQLCGFLMLLMNLIMSGLVAQTILTGRSSSYHEIVVIAIAAYTFYRLTTAIIRVVQSRRNRDPLHGAARNINLTAAMMSLYSLQNTMLTVFGEGDTQYRQMMNTLSGVAVCLLAVLGAAGMVLHGAKRKKEVAQS